MSLWNRSEVQQVVDAAGGDVNIAFKSADRQARILAGSSNERDQTQANAARALANELKKLR